MSYVPSNATSILKKLHPLKLEESYSTGISATNLSATNMPTCITSFYMQEEGLAISICMTVSHH
jgi:hypothetical protein